ncbi:PadR family transcriptional regulator [Brevundimonas naejangsanensis]|uniref:PadR family transcriptional regulator n=1 Tax=Brevundimonas naejangsanensis TaxID=588932 RepID=A0A494RI66_9CAUL|nr:PadR family transcriptional regulator [Brevundimonas naejangsanensis]AYG95109.1 PadR family transcriptional regulator [Brevundimonas naejangsanensis]
MPDTIDIQLKKGVLGLCVLALLARRDSYAYEIASRLSDAIGMGEGTIYPLMRRMQTDGLVETYLVESSSGPSRKYYRLTAGGRRALDGQTTEWRAFARAVEALIAGEAEDVVTAGAPAETPALADHSAEADTTDHADRGEDQ